MDHLGARIAGFSIRHERAIAIASGLWFALSCAVMSRFLVLPQWLDIPYITDRNSFWVTGGWNALFWGFIHPRLDAARKNSRSSATKGQELQ